MAEEERAKVVIEVIEDASRFGEEAKRQIAELAKEVAAAEKEQTKLKREQVELEQRIRDNIGGRLKYMMQQNRLAEQEGKAVKFTKEQMEEQVKLTEIMTRARAGDLEAQRQLMAMGQGIGQQWRVIAESAKEAGQSFEQVLKGMQVGMGKKEGEAWANSMRDARDKAAELGDEVAKTSKKGEEGAKKAAAATNTWGAALKKLSSFSKAILTGLGIGSLIQLFNTITSAIKKSVEAAQEMSMAQYRLQVGIRAAQREWGLAAGTMEEWTGFIRDLRKQFGIFSLVDLTAATAKIVLLTRELGFTKEAMMDVTKASIVLAEVSGRDVEDAARRLALFLDTGYARGLAQLGVQISKSQVEQYALAQGIEKTWNEMTRAERAAISLAAVMEQVNRLTEDAGYAQETLRGQFMLLEAAQKDALVSAGQDFASLMLDLKRIETFLYTDVLPFFARVWKGWKIGITAIMMGLTWWGVAYIAFWQTLRDNTWELLLGRKGIADIFEETSRRATEAALTQRDFMKNFWFAEGDLGDVMGDQMASLESSLLGQEDALEVTGEAWEQFAQQVSDAIAQMEEDMEDLTINLERDLADLRLKLERDFADAFTDLMRDLEDIEIDYHRDRARLIENAAEKDKEVVKENNDRRAELIAEYRLRELQAQREFNIEMAQLEREYLLELEDAVRERDARAVLMLMRKHNLEVQKRTEDFAEERRQAKENLELDLQQVKESEYRKRLEIRKSLNQQLKDLQTAFYQKTQDRYRQYVQELDDLRLRNQREEDDLKESYKRREEDLDRHLKNRLYLLAKRFAEEHNLTFDFVASQWNALDLLSAKYAQVLGQGLIGGATFPTYSSATTSPKIGKTVATVSSSPTKSTSTLTKAKGYAQGGGALARGPTTALFGEGGPEMASFIPLNKMKDFFSQGFGGGSGGRAQVDITVSASPELVVSVIDQTMSEIANVIEKASAR